MPKHFYITTTLPYVNAAPHIGTALEFVEADILARYRLMKGDSVFFNIGTDEHGAKIYQAALKEGLEPQEYVDVYAEKFGALREALGLWDGLNFIRTTDRHHIQAAQEFWRRCDKNGYIQKKQYQAKYCVGCELEKTDSELENGHCPIHPNLDIQILEEENYFFTFSKFRDRLLALYEERPDFIVPDFRFNEIKKFASEGLQDFSISRLAKKMPWGVPVPGDPEHVMYVWFDALVNYISAIGWPDDTEQFRLWWPVVQVAGKDQVRQQGAMWQAMLMAADLPPSKRIIIHGFIMSGGQKMSKSLGNVVDPMALVGRYGTDALRYYLARHMHPFEDSDFTEEKFKEAYNAHLANGLGNLVSRVMKMAETHLEAPVPVADETFNDVAEGKYDHYLARYEFHKAADVIWEEVGVLDAYIQETQPWKMVHEDENKAKDDITYLVGSLAGIAHMLTPFLPETAARIESAIAENKMPQPLFARI